jgi:hypothetical protein
MSMTRETAAEWFETHMPTGRVKPVQKQAYLLALSALRPIRREQVEKAWRGEWIGKDGEKVGTIDGVPIKSATCSSCGRWLTASDEYDCEGHFCPACGKAMTDEAVQMVIERLEELHDTSN